MNVISIKAASISQPLLLPFFISRVSAGFPSPADDYLENELDLNKLLIQHPAATYYVKAIGDSMQNAGIYNGDILVVDRSIKPASGRIVIAVVDNQFTVKRLKMNGNKFYLVPENENYSPVEIKPENNVEIWGVVTSVVHRL